jgi:hypothetical protein
MNRTLLTIVQAVVLILLMCGVGSSATIVVTGIDTAHGEQNLWMNEDGVDVQQYFVGDLFIRVTSGTKNYNRTAYCVDLFTDINLNTTYNTVVEHPSDVVGRPNQGRVSWLIQNYAASVTTAAQGAAFQLAIWDIVHDNGDGFTSGRVQQAKTHTTPSDVITQALTYESLSLGKTSNGAYVYQNSTTNGGVEAQMLMGPAFSDGGPYPTPEPSTLLMVGGAVVVGWQIRRKRRRYSG